MNILTATACVAALCASTVDQDGRAGLADNAALWYWRAFMTLEQYDDRPLEAINAVMMSEGEDEDGRRNVRMFTALAMPDLEQAARLQSCTFAADWENGFMATLPHLSYLNRTFQLFEADATGAIAADEQTIVAERIMLMVTMADHISQEQSIIAHTLAVRFIKQCAELQRRIDPADLSAESRAGLAATWSLLEDLGPGHLASVYAVNQRRTRAGARERWFGDNGEEQLREDFRMMVDVNSGQSPRPGPYDTLDDQFELWKALDETIVNAIRERDQVRLAEIGQELGDGDHGWLARGMTPNYFRAYETMIQSELIVRDMRQMLESQ